jgi:hypothetical protein
VLGDGTLPRSLLEAKVDRWIPESKVRGFSSLKTVIPAQAGIHT